MTARDELWKDISKRTAVAGLEMVKLVDGLIADGYRKVPERKVSKSMTIKDVVEVPVTFRAVQITPDSLGDVDEVLKGTGVRLRSVGAASFMLMWPGTGFFENGPLVDVWMDDWVVVSSLGVVRGVLDRDYVKEFRDA